MIDLIFCPLSEVEVLHDSQRGSMTIACNAWRTSTSLFMTRVWEAKRVSATYISFEKSNLKLEMINHIRLKFESHNTNSQITLIKNGVPSIAPTLQDPYIWLGTSNNWL